MKYQSRQFLYLKINTNKISKHVDIEYHNTYFVPICSLKNTYETLVKLCVMIYQLYALYIGKIF